SSAGSGSAHTDRHPVGENQGADQLPYSCAWRKVVEAENGDSSKRQEGLIRHTLFLAVCPRHRRNALVDRAGVAVAGRRAQRSPQVVFRKGEEAVRRTWIHHEKPGYGSRRAKRHDYG